MAAVSRVALALGAALGLTGALVCARRARARRLERAKHERAIRRLCERLPKAELHAHLHGSARLSTIVELARAGGGGDVGVAAGLGASSRGRSLDECFAIFALIHRAVRTRAALERVVAEVCADFAADGVKYLELRSTPRALEGCANAREYVRAVVRALDEFDARQRAQAAAWPMAVRLLVSVDRARPPGEALAAVDAAVALRAEGGAAARRIVGVDLSGNPTRGSFAELAPALERARAAGLPVVVHAAEVEGRAAETDAILAFAPARLGHALHLSGAQVARLRAAPIPIELCPTSNLTTLRRWHMREHPTAPRWLSSELQPPARTAHSALVAAPPLGAGAPRGAPRPAPRQQAALELGEGVKYPRYPVSINTDDTGVFNTTASRELARVALELALAPERVCALAVRALEHALEQDTAWLGAQAARFRVDAERALVLYYRELEYHHA